MLLEVSKLLGCFGYVVPVVFQSFHQAKLLTDGRFAFGDVAVSRIKARTVCPSSFNSLLLEHRRSVPKVCGSKSHEQAYRRSHCSQGLRAFGRRLESRRGGTKSSGTWPSRNCSTRIGALAVTNARHALTAHTTHVGRRLALTNKCPSTDTEAHREQTTLTMLSALGLWLQAFFGMDCSATNAQCLAGGPLLFPGRP